MPKKTTQSKRDYRAQWQDWLRTMLDSADAALTQAQQRYKRNFDQRVRPSRMSLRPGRHAFLRIDYKSAKDDTRHKLAPLVTGPHRIVSVTDNTVVLELEDLSHERVSLDRTALQGTVQGFITVTRCSCITILSRSFTVSVTSFVNTTFYLRTVTPVSYTHLTLPTTSRV